MSTGNDGITGSDSTGSDGTGSDGCYSFLCTWATFPVTQYRGARDCLLTLKNREPGNLEGLTVPQEVVLLLAT